eukprot:CAMPEP_0170105044 /NCGR_PEP_ID=MMETSP0020_2-20130122/4521_1 /TAXON_ID=98059 /ORGANISM="Dinobryon sp., Strain UTEXLB2267" /LENGTH=826 /DNA_ID=CAMNT_0010329059 /DNA_START=61 /DNA_END=2541 /DNA_ORIENTATION=-
MPMSVAQNKFPALIWTTFINFLFEPRGFFVSVMFCFCFMNIMLPQSIVLTVEITTMIVFLFGLHIKAAVMMLYYDIVDSTSELRTKSTSAKPEYLFIDFNAWEYCASDELWTGMIRILYEKVELRMSHQIDLSTGISFKEKWRVKKAITLLKETYGGKIGLMNSCILFSAVAIHCLTSINSVSKLLKLDVNILNDAIVIIPGIGLLKALYDFIMAGKMSIDKSIGEIIFMEGSTIRDQNGFMSKVRVELTELFEFITNEFNPSSKTKLTLVLFIDDLDRVLDGRNVKMLEAIQLLLNVPGAPVLVFLAIDSRIVVASIEQHFNKSMKIEDAMITGWEYLEKIVQIPFCIPEISPEIVKGYLKSILINSITLNELENTFVRFNKICGDKLGELNLRKIEQPLYCKFPFLQGSEQHVKISAVNFLAACKDKETSPHDRLSLVGSLLKCPSACKAQSKDKEEVERLCGEIHSAITKARFYIMHQKPSKKPSSSTNSSNVSTNATMPSTNASTNAAMPSSNASVARSEVDEFEDRELGDTLFEDKNSDGEMYLKESTPSQEESPRLLETMSVMLESVIGKVECNPRSIKRSVNLLQIISEIAKNKPVTDLSPPVKIAEWEGGKKWRDFSKKAVLWIFMAQNFTFRLSALVQVLLDFEQKRDFNNLSRSYKYKKISLQSKASDKEPPNSDQIDNFDEMFIFDFYQKYVEKFIHVFRHADRLSRVDKDPEEFAFLLGKCNDIDMKCEDILGPQIDQSANEDTSNPKEVQRRKDFSLLSYSFNLDPAMRLEIGDDMASLMSEHEMFDEKGFILQKESIMRKKNFLNCRGEEWM